MRKLGKQFAVGVGQEFIAFKGERDAVLLDPGGLSFHSVLLVSARVSLQLANVVAELIIGHDEGSLVLGIRNAVGVIVVLRRCQNHHSEFSQHIQSGDTVGYLLRFHLLHPHLHQFLLFAHFGVVEEVIWKEANHLVTVLLPEADRDLNSLTTEP